MPIKNDDILKKMFIKIFDYKSKLIHELIFVIIVSFFINKFSNENIVIDFSYSIDTLIVIHYSLLFSISFIYALIIREIIFLEKRTNEQFNITEGGNFEEIHKNILLENRCITNFIIKISLILVFAILIICNQMWNK